MNRKFAAFSLIELSIVILVIGILVAGVMEGKNLLNKSKLSAARALSQSSDVNSIKNLVVWVDATRENTITNTSNSKNVSDGDYIQSWLDVTPQYTPNLSFSTSTTNTYPIYRENAINGLPALEFDGVNAADGDLLEISGSAAGAERINQLDNFAIFAVFTALPGYNVTETRIGILMKQLISVNNETYGMSFIGSNKTISSIVTDGNNTTIFVNTTSNAITNSVPAIGFVQHATGISSGFVVYLNGTLLGSRNAQSSIRNGVSNLTIGKGRTSTRYFKGYISELIMYNEALTPEERKSVTKYLSQKWGIAVSQ
ncbi:MAG: hypothetical protein KGQ36_03930 [Rickettsiales bacterium]|nr:hypothetical protein [Rickettsiales bacterium]